MKIDMTDNLSYFSYFSYFTCIFFHIGNEEDKIFLLQCNNNKSVNFHSYSERKSANQHSSKTVACGLQ